MIQEGSHRGMLKMLESEIEYKARLERDWKIVSGGPFLDVSALLHSQSAER